MGVGFGSGVGSELGLGSGGKAAGRGDSRPQKGQWTGEASRVLEQRRSKATYSGVGE